MKSSGGRVAELIGRLGNDDLGELRDVWGGSVGDGDGVRRRGRYCRFCEKGVHLANY